MNDVNANPFGLTKANDLTDDQIQALWVDVGASDSPTSLFSAGRFSSPMPTFILGGKGSGKTHLMRYASYPLQKLRYIANQTPVSDGLRQNGYLGIYIRFSVLETGRFNGKGQSDDAWLEVFSYYLEITAALAVLMILQDLTGGRDDWAAERHICVGIRELFNVSAPCAETLGELIQDLDDRRKLLDFQVSDAAFSGVLRPEIAVSRGRLMFGLPRLIQHCMPELAGIVFSYQLDEFENLTLQQQRHVNTLVRHPESPASLKIGARQFGIKTRGTLSANEENIKDSEFDELRLDQRFRSNEKTYAELAERLIERRLHTFWPRSAWESAEGKERLSLWFDEPDVSWRARRFNQLVKEAAPENRPHMRKLRGRLESSLNRPVPGVKTRAHVDTLLTAITCEPYPLLEKLNTTLIFNAWANNRSVLEEAHRIADEMQDFLNGKPASRYKQKLDHYKSDITAQMIRDADSRQEYAGLQTFIRMSEGQPRALITLLKQIFDWASFQGEKPFEAGVISVEAQSKGALAAAEWFYNSMRTSGDEERPILTVINRLAELFRINRYADNPIECSLIGFSANHISASSRAAETLKLAVDRSFIVEVPGGQAERNSDRVTTKYQLNRMLVPRWGLPTARRGIKPFGADEVNAIFDPSNETGFNALAADWRARMDAPFAGQRKGTKVTMPEPSDADQSDLFP
jgi:hypothetical protein